MRYRVEQVKTDLFADDARPEEIGALAEAACQKRLKRLLGKTGGALSLRDAEVLHWSLDARDKSAIKLVRTVAFSSEKELPLPPARELSYESRRVQHLPDERPVVVGFGPAGLFCALLLAEAGMCPLVIERGGPMAQRISDVERYWREGVLDAESNVQFGEGGAGTFSDGKLTSNVRDVRIAKVFDEFIEAGADPRIRLVKKPHLGTDRLREIVPRLRDKIVAHGGEVRFGVAVTALEKRSETGPLGRTDKVTGVRLSDGTHLPASAVVFAIGHSARDTYTMLLAAGLEMTPKPFSIGARIEHPQENIDRAMYGERWKEVRDVVGPAEYKLAMRTADDRGVYTFCMCPGGEIVLSASAPGEIVTNGMSLSARASGRANSAVLVDVRTTDFRDVADIAPMEAPWMEPLTQEMRPLLAGALFQQHYEHLAYQLGKGTAPTTRFADLAGSAVAASLPSWAAADMATAIDAFGAKIRGFDDPEARLVGVETRSSAPVRVVRGEDYQANIAGVYPAGEGAGYAGGITSAALDGIRVAEAIIDAAQTAG